MMNADFNVFLCSDAIAGSMVYYWITSKLSITVTATGVDGERAFSKGAVDNNTD